MVVATSTCIQINVNYIKLSLGLSDNLNVK